MLKEYLNVDIYKAILANFSFEHITEIRMRTNARLIVTINTKKYFLKNGTGNYIICDCKMISDFILKCSENSMYAFNESIKLGYLTLKNGIRVGIAGQVVTDGEKIITIKDIQSVNIRIPHFIRNCSLLAYDFLVDERVKNTLIISSPGAGKTTFLRDFIFQLYAHNNYQNVLLVDERNEIASSCNGVPLIDLGGFCDVYTNCNKKFAFINGIRSMSPDVIITDEINLEQDVESLDMAMNSGVNVVATIHASDINDLLKKNKFQEILDKKYFNRFVILNKSSGVGTLAYIYDENLKIIYCRC